MSDFACERVSKIIITLSNQLARYFSTFIKIKITFIEQIRVYVSSIEDTVKKDSLFLRFVCRDVLETGFMF